MRMGRSNETHHDGVERKGFRMKAGATKDYRFGQKNNWRRWLWNEIRRRKPPHKLNGPILYLAGKEDRDRQVAIEKGYAECDLIAVEKHAAVRDELRALHVNTVQGNLSDVIYSYPPERDIGVIIADYCSGLYREQADLSGAISNPAATFSVIAVNLQRGRDPQSATLREMLRGRHLFLAADADSIERIDIDIEKHRGAQYFIMDCLMLMEPFLTTQDHRLNPGISRAIVETIFKSPKLLAILGRFMTIRRPSFFSYKSTSGVYMDSVIFENMPGGDGGLPQWLTRKYMNRAWRKELNFEKFADHRRHIAAAIAVRTMRAA